MFYYKSFKDSPFNQLLSDNILDNANIVEQVRLIFESSKISEITNSLLKGVLENKPVDSLYTDSFNADTSLMEWRLARSEVATCTLKILHGKPHLGRESFYLYPNDVFIYFYGNGHCDAVLYEFADINNFDQFDRDRSLVSKTSLSLKSGEYLFLKAGVHGLQLLDVQDIIMFEVCSVKHHNIVWNFSTKTNKMCYPSSADVSSTRLTVAMDVLCFLGDKNSESIIENIIQNHHQHFVRWKGIETLAVLNKDKALDLLNKALKDEHPEIRKAARESLELNGVTFNG